MKDFLRQMIETKTTFKKYRRNKRIKLKVKVKPLATRYDGDLLADLKQSSLLAPEDEDKLTPKKYRFPYPITIEGDTLTLCKYEEMEEYLNG